MVLVENLSKKYYTATKFSLKNFSVSIEDGEILGLIGLNGAGKSTFIKCITGIIPYEQGRIIIDGVNLKTHEIEAKRKIGFVPDDHSVYENLTGREYCNFIADIYKVPLKERNRIMRKYVSMFRLTDAFDDAISSYSHGMKQKICIIGSIIHSPRIWILDEPMVGLDPKSMQEVKEVIYNYKKDGNNVIFSSHNIQTAQNICDKIAIIHNGELMEFIDLQRNPGMDLESYFFLLTNS